MTFTCLLRFLTMNYLLLSLKLILVLVDNLLEGFYVPQTQSLKI